jgi:hypothetical protein
MVRLSADTFSVVVSPTNSHRIVVDFRRQTPDRAEMTSPQYWRAMFFVLVLKSRIINVPLSLIKDDGCLQSDLAKLRVFEFLGDIE